MQWDHSWVLWILGVYLMVCACSFSFPLFPFRKAVCVAHSLWLYHHCILDIKLAFFPFVWVHRWKAGLPQEPYQSSAFSYAWFKRCKGETLGFRLHRSTGRVRWDKYISYIRRTWKTGHPKAQCYRLMLLWEISTVKPLSHCNDKRVGALGGKWIMKVELSRSGKE